MAVSKLLSARTEAEAMGSLPFLLGACAVCLQREGPKEETTALERGLMCGGAVAQNPVLCTSPALSEAHTVNFQWVFFFLVFWLCLFVCLFNQKKYD